MAAGNAGGRSQRQRAAPAGDRGLLPRPDGRQPADLAGRPLGRLQRVRRASSRTTARAQKCWSRPATPPRRRDAVLHYGKDITDPSWTDDNRLHYTADRQQWTVDPAECRAPLRRSTRRCPPALSGQRRRQMDGARQGQAAAASTTRPTRSDFERRHEERFKGVHVRLEGLPARRAALPAPNLRARPAAQLVIQPAGGGDAPRCSSTPISGPRTSRGTRMARCSRSPPIRTGATSSNTKAPISGR